jgi:hypothetical protein
MGRRQLERNRGWLMPAPNGLILTFVKDVAMRTRLFRHSRWIVPVCLVAGVLGLWGTVGAQNEGTPGAGKPPFANAVDQREEMIRELRQIHTLMKEQNSLLKQLVDNAQGNKPKR